MIDSSTRAPRVSIALCTYNGEKYLEQQLASLWNQSFSDFEIVAVDDKSGDATVSILQAHAKSDNRLRIAVNEANLGFRRNFETALRACNGALIAPCDQDDVWQPTKLEELIACIGERSLAYCDSELIDSAGVSLGVRISDKFNMISTNDPTPFARSNCVSGHAMLFQKELVELALPIPDGFFHDWWIAAVAASRNGIVYCEKPLVRYRQHATTVTDLMKAKGPARSRGKTGVRLQSVLEIGQRLEHLSKLPGPQQTLLRELHSLWIARIDEWLSIRLARLFVLHRNPLFAIEKISAFKRIRKALRLVLGVRTKRTISRRAYSRI